MPHATPLPPNPLNPQALLFPAPPTHLQTPFPSKHQSPCILPKAAMPSKPYSVPIFSPGPNAPSPHRTPQTPHSPLLLRNHNSTISSPNSSPIPNLLHLTYGSHFPPDSKSPMLPLRPYSCPFPL